jgi:hypothetical protein
MMLERWRLLKSGRTARCLQAAHPLGTELRVLLGDDDLRRSEVFRAPAAADAAAAAWCASFEAKGWREPAPRFAREALERARDETIAAARRVPGDGAIGHVLSYRLKVMHEAIEVALDETLSLDQASRERRLLDAMQELARAERGPEGQALVRPILQIHEEVPRD